MSDGATEVLKSRFPVRFSSRQNQAYGKLSRMRCSSERSTSFCLPSRRRRLEFLQLNKWRLPELERLILPLAVILKRLATAFRVFCLLIPL